eukprot:6173242-Prymnesium_polylepis.1
MGKACGYVVFIAIPSARKRHGPSGAQAPLAPTPTCAHPLAANVHLLCAVCMQSCHALTKMSSGYVSRSQERSCALGVALEGGLVGDHVGVGPQRPRGVRTVVRGI